MASKTNGERKCGTQERAPPVLCHFFRLYLFVDSVSSLRLHSYLFFHLLCFFPPYLSVYFVFVFLFYYCYLIFTKKGGKKKISVVSKAHFFAHNQRLVCPRTFFCRWVCWLLLLFPSLPVVPCCLVALRVPIFPFAILFLGDPQEGRDEVGKGGFALLPLLYSLNCARAFR